LQWKSNEITTRKRVAVEVGRGTASANSTVSSIFHAVRITNATCDISFNDDILGSVTATVDDGKTVNDGKSITSSKDDPLPLDLTLHNIQLPSGPSFSA